MNVHRWPIIIVGMQRSGTSALAGALSKLGVFFGKEEWLYPPDANNREGYFEHRKATILNLRCLDTFQMHPTSFGTMPTNWKAHPIGESLRSELREFISTDFSKKGKWGIKQPVTSLVMPLYNDVFDELGILPHYVLCVRNPLETMESEARLDFGDAYRVMAPLEKRAVGSWLRYTLGAFVDAVGHPLTVVSYEEFLTAPKQVLEQIVSRHEDWEPTTEMWEAAVGSIRTGLRHNRIEVDRLNELPPLVENAFIAATSFDDLDPKRWEGVIDLHGQFNAWVNLMSESQAPAGKFGLAWLMDGEQQISEVAYLPTGDWQTIRISVAAPPKTNVSGLLYGWPFRAWIRKCVWVSGAGKAPAHLRTGIGSNLRSSAGVYRLEGVFEPNQINATTPGFLGPYELELEILLESGLSVSQRAAANLAEKLERSACVVERFHR